MVIQPGAGSHAPSLLQQSLAASAADGAGAIVDVSNHSQWVHAEIVKTGTGTCSVVLEGSDNGAAFYPVRYQQMDAEPRPAENNVAITQAAGAVAHVYQILDRYPFVRARETSTAGVVVLTVTIYAEAGGRA